MDNKKIPTSTGAIILVIITITAGVFVWVYEKEQNWDFTTTQFSSIPKKIVKDDKPAKNTHTDIVITEPIEQWRTCRNEKLGYEVKYPNSWKTYHDGPWGNIPEQCGATTNPEFIISPEDEFNVEKANFRVIYTNTSNLGIYSLDEYLQKNPHYLDEKFNETLIQGKQAIWGRGDNGYTYVLTYNSNKVFIIREKNVAPDSFNDFLSTFKFLP